MSSLLQHGARKTLTDCREKHVVQKQCDKDDEENQFPRLTPSREALHHFCRQPRRITDNHCRRRLTSTVRQKKIRETSATITSFTVHRSRLSTVVVAATALFYRTLRTWDVSEIFEGDGVMSSQWRRRVCVKLWHRFSAVLEIEDPEYNSHAAVSAVDRRRLVYHNV